MQTSNTNSADQNPQPNASEQQPQQTNKKPIQVPSGTIAFLDILSGLALALGAVLILIGIFVLASNSFAGWTLLYLGVSLCFASPFFKVAEYILRACTRYLQEHGNV